MEETTNEAIVQKKTKKPLVVCAILLGMMLAVYLVFCVIAANTETIYPGRSMRGIDVGGMTVAQATEHLDAEFSKHVFTIRPTTGETDPAMEPITLLYATLGAGLDSDMAARIAHKEFAPGNFVSNGWEYISCLLGWDKRLNCCDLTLDEAAFRQGNLQLLASLSRDPQDASFQLKETSISVTTALDGQKIAPMQGELAFEDFLRQRLSTAEGMDLSLEILSAKTLTAQAIHDEISGKMANAGYDPSTKSITPERIGADFDAAAAQTLLGAAAPGETVEIPAELHFPTVTAQALEGVLFRDVLGTYTTHVGGSAARIGNVKLSAGTIDDFIMNAGEIFSYNDVVGQRTAANGYLPAPAYVKGETVDEIGGGICQTSSTLYYAALLSNLEIVERYAHRYAPAYIPWGMDATVSWGGPEFRFANNADYPVKLVTSMSQKNNLTVTIFGTKTDELTVKMTTSVLSDTPFEVIRQDDPSLAPGTEKVKITPYTGHKVEAYRNLYGGDGKLISSTRESVSNYKARNQVILVGPKLAEPVLPPEGSLPAGGEAIIPDQPISEPPAEPDVPAEPSSPPDA